jgi:hypothetical protein
MVVIAVSGSSAGNNVHQLRIRNGKIQVISYTKICNTWAGITTLHYIIIIIIIIIIICQLYARYLQLYT